MTLEEDTRDAFARWRARCTPSQLAQLKQDAQLMVTHYRSGMSPAQSKDVTKALGWDLERVNRAIEEADSIIAAEPPKPITPMTRRRLRGAPTDADVENFSEVKTTALKSMGFTSVDNAKDLDAAAQEVISRLKPGEAEETAKAKVLDLLRGMTAADAKKVVARVQEMLNSQEGSLKGEMGKVKRTRQHADDLIKGVIDPYERPTPLMSFLLHQAGMDLMTEEFISTAWDSASKEPLGGWEDRVAGEMATRLLGKAKLNGRLATAEEIKDSVEAHNLLLSKLSANARAVHRMLVTATAFNASRGQPVDADLGRFVEISRWAEQAALKYWTDPAFREQGGSAAVHEARLTVIARLMREIAERADLGPLQFNQAVHVIMIWWTADERVPNTTAEETVHGLLQAGPGGQPEQTSSWAEPTLRWLADWQQSAFARINVGHKLAAALALTDVPQDVPHSPWRSWSLVIPEGMFSPTERTEGWDLVAHNHQSREEASKLLQLISDEKRDRWTGVVLRRAWFHGTTLIGVCADWWFEGGDAANVPPLQCSAVSITEESMKTALGEELHDMVRSLGLGVLAAITNQPPRKSGQWGLTKKRSGHKKPDKTPIGEIWDVAAPVTIDLRDHVRSMQTGKGRKGHPTTAAWVVRGHWRNQVHGPGRALRRQTWIEPFWKGDASMRKLMRGVEVKE